jgi:hypothetical protein
LGLVVTAVVTRAPPVRGSADFALIRRYISWRNHHADDTTLRAVVDTANVA